MGSRVSRIAPRRAGCWSLRFRADDFIIVWERGSDDSAGRTASPDQPGRRRRVAAGAVVSVALGVYGSQHQPTGQAIFTFGFGSMIAMKVWLGLAVGALALVQLVSALWMYGKLGRPAGRAVAITHRLSGTTAILVSLPVAYSCLWSLGFQTYDTRVLVHSLFGCVLYGAFVTKILALKSGSSPGWLLPSPAACCSRRSSSWSSPHRSGSSAPPDCDRQRRLLNVCRRRLH